MANIIYLKIQGKNQGLISAGCSSFDSVGNKYQANHQDQILVYSVDHELSYRQNVAHHPVVITKGIDKSSPLLNNAITTGELLDCELNFYRISVSGGIEPYYLIKLQNAKLQYISIHYPNSLTDDEQQPFEQLHLSYETISWKHIKANTYAYAFWDDVI